MKELLPVLKRPAVISLIGVLALSVLVWYVGPMLAFGAEAKRPFAGVASRLFAIEALLVLWALKYGYDLVVARRKNTQLVEGIAGVGEASGAVTSVRATSEEAADLRDKFKAAADALKSAKLGYKWRRQYVFEMPWYALIGPSGCGKTTALLNSELSFPLAERLGFQREIQGAQGTQNCDWFITDEAVLIDTAGRYATQDHSPGDRPAWLEFLKLLRKYRRAQPLNGVLVAYSASDLLDKPDEELDRQAQEIRQRVQELYDQLGVRLPIYVLFTKCDLLGGFLEFFDHLKAEERAQVWGTTYSREEGDDPKRALARFADRFASLENRLNDWLLERLERETDLRRRQLIYTFPQQFGALREPAQRFLRTVFDASHFESKPVLRGVYFTSGTQEGPPIDRVLASLAPVFGVQREALPSFSRTGRSYFINRLLREVIFPEAELVGTNPRVERTRLWLRTGLLGGLAAVTALTLMGWTVSYLRNAAYLERVQQGLVETRESLGEVSRNPRSLASIVPLLDRARALSEISLEKGGRVPISAGLGLYQGESVGPPAQLTYLELLVDLLLPRIILRLEDQLRQPNVSADFLYEGLRTYLMLGQQGRDHFDAKLVEKWVRDDWRVNLTSEIGQAARQSLYAHLEAVPAAPLDRMPVGLGSLDESLVSRVRREVSRLPASHLVYARLKATDSARQLPPFDLGRAVGPGADAIFARRSEKSLDAAVPGLYTRDGYRQVIRTEGPRLAEARVTENWVLQDEGSGPTARSAAALAEEVRRLYFRDYIDTWNALLSDLEITPFQGNASKGLEVVESLSDADSPLRTLIMAVAEQTALNGTDPVATHFKDLRRLVTATGKREAPLEKGLRILSDLHVRLASTLTMPRRAGLGSTNAAADEVFLRLRLYAEDQPPPVNRWLLAVAQDSSSLLGSLRKQELNSAWQTVGLRHCQRALEGHYPLAPGSTTESTIEDFGKFFGENGIVDSFFRRNLAGVVDTTRRPWTTRPGAPFRLSTDTLRQFQRAAVIRETFFRGGGDKPSIQFELKPIQMDVSISIFTLIVDGQRVTWDHGPVSVTQLVWPGSGDRKQVRIRLEPPSASGVSGLREDGPWAWLKMLDRARVEPTEQPGRYHVTFNIGGRQALWELRASSARHSYGLQELAEFRCPRNL